MTEIEKMFENAGIKCLHPSGFCKHIGATCKVCERHKYPPFNAEKQLLLIQWLAKTRPIHINFLLDKWAIEGMVRYGIKYDTFEDALSGYINQIWKDLTDQDKEEIRNILNA